MSNETKNGWTDAVRRAQGKLRAHVSHWAPESRLAFDEDMIALCGLCVAGPQQRQQPKRDELAEVRADIMRTAAAVQALSTAMSLYGPEDEIPTKETAYLESEVAYLRKLRLRERELMTEAKG